MEKINSSPDNGAASGHFAMLAFVVGGDEDEVVNSMVSMSSCCPASASASSSACTVHPPARPWRGGSECTNVRYLPTVSLNQQ